MQKTLGLISEFSLQTPCHTQSLHPGLNVIQVHHEWQQALSKSNKCLSCWFVLHQSIIKFSMGEMDFSFTFHFTMLFEIVWNKQRVQKETDWILTQNSPKLGYCLSLVFRHLQIDALVMIKLRDHQLLPTASFLQTGILSQTPAGSDLSKALLALEF